MLFETGRFYLRSVEGELVPLSWDQGEPWRFVLSVEAQADGQTVPFGESTPSRRRDHALSAADRFLQGDPDLMIRGGVLAGAGPRLLQLAGCSSPTGTLEH